MYCFIVNDQVDQICSVGQFFLVGEVYWQLEVGVEEKGFEEYVGDFFFQWFVGLIVIQYQLCFVLQGIVVFVSGEGGIYFFVVVQCGKDGVVRVGMNCFYKVDV